MTARPCLNPFGDSSKNFAFFPSLSHKKTVHRITRGLESDCGLILLTGEIGIGKTSLARHIQATLKDRFAFVELGNPYQTPMEMIYFCCERFGLPTAGLSSIHDCVALLESHFQTLLEQGKRAVIVFDESHLLTKRHLSLIHILSNLRAREKPLLQLVLVGQLEILDLLATKGMEALNQRIGVRCELSPLDREDAAKYIRFKLDKGRCKDAANFPSGTVDRIWKESRGLPRLINHICAHAMDALAFRDNNVVTKGMVEEVCRDSVYTGLFGNNEPTPRPKRQILPVILSVCGFAALLLAVWLHWGDRIMAKVTALPQVARTTNHTVQGTVAPPAPPKVRPTASPSETAPQISAATGQEQSDPAPVLVVEEADIPGTILNGDIHPVIGNFVIGALAWNEKPESRVVVVDSRLLHEGETVDDAKVLHIENGWILFEYKGQQYKKTFSP